MKTTTKQSGFTLVELAIVLVIIGLIVGGVLAGQDLIKAATMQKAVKQVGDTETAAATFRTKYNDLPGDLKNASSVISGPWSGGLLETGMGDGNGVIESTTTGVTATTVATATVGASGESLNFYPMIAAAGYIKESRTGQAMSVVTATAAQIKAAWLPSALGNDIYITASGKNGKNYILFVGAPSGAAAAGIATLTAALTPLEASSIDSKLDDGFPATGNVVSVAVAAPTPTTGTGVNGHVTASLVAGDCYDSTTTAGVYAATLSGGTCNLSIRASF